MPGITCVHARLTQLVCAKGSSEMLIQHSGFESALAHAQQQGCTSKALQAAQAGSKRCTGQLQCPQAAQGASGVPTCSSMAVASRHAAPDTSSRFSACSRGSLRAAGGACVNLESQHQPEAGSLLHHQGMQARHVLLVQKLVQGYCSCSSSSRKPEDGPRCKQGGWPPAAACWAP